MSIFPVHVTLTFTRIDVYYGDKMSTLRLTVLIDTAHGFCTLRI